MRADTSQYSAAPDQRQRKHRRFDLHFPVYLSFPSRGTVRELDAISRNVSIGGLLLGTSDSLPLHITVSLIMELRGPRLRSPVRLQSEGEVVRVERLESTEFAIAIKCKRPIAELEDDILATG